MFENHKVTRKNTIWGWITSRIYPEIYFLAFKVPHMGFKLTLHLWVDKNAISALFYEGLNFFGFEPTGGMTHLVGLFFWTFQLFISESIAVWRPYGEYSSFAIIKNVSCGANDICWIELWFRAVLSALFTTWKSSKIRKFDRGAWLSSSCFVTLGKYFLKFRRRKLPIATGDVAILNFYIDPHKLSATPQRLGIAWNLVCMLIGELS